MRGYLLPPELLDRKVCSSLLPTVIQLIETAASRIRVKFPSRALPVCFSLPE